MPLYTIPAVRNEVPESPDGARCTETMPHLGLPLLIAVFAWWFSTGAILLVVRRADRTGAAAHAMTVVCCPYPCWRWGLAGLRHHRRRTGVTGVYLAFLSALAIWGWIELAFLSGVITGPERRACPPELSGWPRFTRALSTLAHHELLLLAGLALVAFAAREGGNGTALWTYTILFVARILAKLNLFFGVPRINIEFMPCPAGAPQELLPARPDHTALPGRRSPC